jgi:serine protease Do
MNIIKNIYLICFSIIFFSCATFNISSTDNNVDTKNKSFVSTIEISKESIVLLTTSPFEDPTVDPTKNGVCSGVIVDKIGHIITNYHCIHNQKTILLYYHNKDDYNAYKVDIVGIDPLADLAVLSVVGGTKNTPYLKFAKNTKVIKEGTDVFALGHPMGMAWTVTKGIVSSNERYTKHPYIYALQTDAAVNQGNSGGPLMNMQGEIVGINVLIVSRVKENAGVGLAIRGDIVEASLKSILKFGKVSRPAVGIQIMPLGLPRQREIILKEYPDLNPDHVPNVSGMFVREATGEDKLPEGLEKYDTVIGVNGKLFNDGIAFLHVLEEYEVGEQVSLNVIRKGRFILVDVVLKVLPIDVELLYTKK